MTEAEEIAKAIEDRVTDKISKLLAVQANLTVRQKDLARREVYKSELEKDIAELTRKKQEIEEDIQKAQALRSRLQLKAKKRGQ